MPRLLGLVLALACTASQGEQTLSEQEAVAIQATVIRSELAGYASAASFAQPLRYCLDTSRRTDPSQALIDVLSGEWAPVVMRSRCGKPCAIPEDFAGDRFACVFVTIGDAVPLEDGSAIVRGSFLAGPLFGRGGLYRLRKDEGAWRVTAYEVDWVS